ncbi:glutamate receptor ionotropic, delta-1-like [Anopheles bellator]|uniref:glutamate receptor ionotropic, delta-1-like n=1 Tax=Anopheles bellator TaxID=139047 RepID=UPI0026471088|nr:glutamate receptor ionotropic, delta-1-like [Anopheles bellator]
MSLTTSLMAPEDIGSAPSIGVLLRFIILKYYAHYYSVCSIGNDFLSDVQVGRILLSTDALHSGVAFQLAIDAGCQAFVVDEPGIGKFLDRYIPVHDTASQRSMDKSVILLLTDENRRDMLEMIAQHETFREILNVLIVVYESGNERPISLYSTETTFVGVLEAYSMSLRPIEVDWNDWESVDFFPDKSSDLQGYVIRMAMCNYLPFTGYERVEPWSGNAYDPNTGTRSIWLDGTELQLIVSFCQKRNCSLLVYTEDEDEWGTVYPNGTGNGLLGSVAERRSDLAVAAIYHWLQPYNFSEYTASISRSGVTVLVPKPHVLPFWRTPFLSFSGPLWAAVLGTFVMGIGATFYVGHLRHRLLVAIDGDRAASEKLTLSEAVLMMVGFFVAQSGPIRTDLLSCVVLFASLLLAGFMVSNCYSAGLAGIMTVPQYDRSIDTVAEFAASGMIWYGPTPYCLEEIFNATEPYLKKIVSSYRVASPPETKLHAQAAKTGFIIEQTQNGNFAPNDFLDRRTSTFYQKLLDDVYFQNCAALSTKTNPLRASLNDYILRVQQSGILYHWGTMTAIRYLPTEVFRNIANARQHLHDGDAAPLEIGHFLGAFFILGYGLLFAGLVFFFELCGTKMAKRLKERLR